MHIALINGHVNKGIYFFGSHGQESFPVEAKYFLVVLNRFWGY